jgi:hypothetical protein
MTVGVYAPEEENIEFYELLHSHLNSINKSDYLAVCGDFNTRVGQQPIERILGMNGENVLNDNGKTLKNFAAFNESKITNTFFRHKNIHKYTWSARGTKSIIDYVLTNSKLSPQVRDTRVYRSCDICTDHFMIVLKINIPARWIHKERKKLQQLKAALKCTYYSKKKRKLYSSRRRNYLDHRAISTNINIEWQDLKDVILKTANEVLRKRSSENMKRSCKHRLR